MPEQKYEMKERQRASRYQIIREESSAIEIAVLYWEMDNDRQNGHAVVKSNRRAVDEEHILAGKAALEWDNDQEVISSHQPEIFRFGGVLIIKYNQIEWKDKRGQ